MIRANASGKTLVKYFVELAALQGRKYKVVVPWDERNLTELKEFYNVPDIIEYMEYYFRVKQGGWSVKDFIYEVPKIADRMEADEVSRAQFKKLMEETRQRMKEAGYEV